MASLHSRTIALSAEQPPKSTASQTAQLNERDLLTLIAMQQIDGLGSATLAQLLSKLERPADLLRGDLDLSTVAILKPKARRALLNLMRSPESSRTWIAAQKMLNWMASVGARLIDHRDPDFPQLLLQLPDCPPFIYFRGDASLLNRKAISIVGARKPTVTGKTFAESLARDLASAGFVVVSGMAMGIDSAAHRGALQVSGKTLAVWATGLDRVYPSSATGLAQEIAHQGAVLTEMPLATPPLPGCFPRRNRLVAGLSIGTIVVEAKVASGSLITARLALEQNREVFAVPGSINSTLSRGCHQLIKEGATLIESSNDVLQALNGFQSIPLNSETPNNTDLITRALEPELQRVVATFEGEPLPFEIILARSGITIDKLSQLLIDLELQGQISQEAGLYHYTPH